MTTHVSSDKIQIKAALFDMDGLLIDTERIYTYAAEQLLARYGRDPVFPIDVKSRMMGRPAPDAAAIFLAWSGIDLSVDAYVSELATIQYDLFPHANVLPGVETLLRKMSRDGVTMAVATSSTRVNFELKTSLLKDLFEVFQGRIVCGDDDKVAGRGKPKPDIFLAAMDLVNARLRSEGKEEVRPSECLVFEDGVPGVTAGLSAGMHVLWVPDDAILELHEDQVETILGDRGRMVKSLEVFPWSDYGL